MTRLPSEIERPFLARVARDRARLAALWQHVATAGPPPLPPDPRLREIGEIAHGLNGAGGTFGFPDISIAAERLEQIVDAGAEPGSALADAIEALLHVLGRDR